MLVLFVFAALVLLKDSLSLVAYNADAQGENNIANSECNENSFKADSRLYLFCGKPLPVNRADQVSLEMLPGIGPHLAEEIISYRDENGKFYSEEELLAVRGIGEKTLAKLSGKLSFD